MSAVPRRSSADLARLARLQGLGGRLAIAGLVGAIAGVGGLLALAGSAQALATPQAFSAAGPALLALLAIVVGGLLGAIGLAIYLIVPGLDAELARRGYDSPATILACLAAVLVLGNVLAVPALIASGSGSLSTLSASGLGIAILSTEVALMTVLVWRVVRPGAITWEDMGLTTVRLGRRSAQGLVGGVAILVLARIAGALMMLLGVEQTQQEMFRAVRAASPLQFVGVWLIISIVVPIGEETFFRGYIFAALRGRYGRWIAYPGSALLFATVHFDLAAIVPIMVMALGLAFLYDRSRSVVPTIVAHGLNNAVSLTILYLVVTT